MPKQRRSCGFPRGVWVADVEGPNGEMVLFAMKSGNRLAAPAVIVPHGLSQHDVADDLWELLDAVDPQGAARQSVRESLRLIRSAASSA